MAIDLDRNSGFFNPWLEVWFGILTIYCCKLVKYISPLLLAGLQTLVLHGFRFDLDFRIVSVTVFSGEMRFKETGTPTCNVINESIEEKDHFPNFFMFNIV